MQRSDDAESEETLGAPSADDDLLTGIEADIERADRKAERDADDDSGRTGIRGRLGRLFSPKLFLATLLLTVVAMAVGGSIPLVGFVGRFVGLFAVAFAVGLVAKRRHYLEVAAAGGVASGLGFLLSTLSATFLPVAADLLGQYGVAIAGGGAVAGMLVALLGHYFGRDLRDGLTKGV
ncbi:hypothetical protein SAMN04487949_1788 [Halogranum gelatinilyticum]|uniref:Uncharacterized protein n=1 Tax=Halogranum gelatinilyticum TaxID=660521 RepID=A0A1G9TK36_9EURY|nr:hypothetical protein [Halogranum gelatinilyticum]SDM47535.1 hypothetical protein SAMN04487949_1788 [Halogranum gelatinilyticum]